MLKLVSIWSGESERLVTRTYIEVGGPRTRLCNEWGNGKNAKHQHDIHTYSITDILILIVKTNSNLLCILLTTFTCLRSKLAYGEQNTQRGVYWNYNKSSFDQFHFIHIYLVNYCYCLCRKPRVQASSMLYCIIHSYIQRSVGGSCEIVSVSIKKSRLSYGTVQ